MKLLVVLLLVGCAAACTNLKRLKVKQQWAQAFKTNQDRMDFGYDLWNRIFTAAPNARALFSRVEGDNIYSNKFSAHAMRVLGGLDMCISLLDDEATLNAELAHLKMQHVSRGLPANGFDIFRDALMASIAAHRTDIRHKIDTNAWMACFAVIADGIQ